MEELQKEVDELKQRVKKLEKKEKKRTRKEITKLIIKLIILVGILFGLYRGYVYVNNTFIKPLKETINKVEEISSDITDNDLYNKIFGNREKEH